MAAALVNQLAKRLLAVPELGDQPLKSFGFFDRVQVGALDILHQRQFESGGVVQLPDNGRNLVQPRRLCRPPAPFAGDDFIATAAERADENRLKQRSEEHTSELQSLMRISYAVFCLKKKKSQI